MYAPSLIDVHYPNRPEKLSSMCLYDFAKHIDWYDRDSKGERTYRRLVKPRVVNHYAYDTNKKEQEQEYYYCRSLSRTLTRVTSSKTERHLKWRSRSKASWLTTTSSRRCLKLRR